MKCCSNFQNCNNTVACFAPPKLKGGMLNPQAYKPALGFTKTGRTYTTQDARLFDSPRAMQLCLNAPPADSSVWMDYVYDPAFVPPIYNREYTSYKDITPGQIIYYIDPEVAPAFRKQIYNLDGATRVDMFRTPMDKVEPMFYLQPDQQTYNNISKDTFARDQLYFRNEITALQQRGHNKTRYEAIK